MTGPDVTEADATELDATVPDTTRPAAIPATSPGSIVLGVTAKQSLGLVTPLAAGLADRGWDVTVVSDITGDHRAKTAPNVSYVAIPMKREPAPLDDVVSLLGWVRFLASKRPDVVMAGTPKASLLALAAARMVGTKTRIYHLRGLRLETVPPGVKRRVLEALEKVTASCATSLLSVSRSLGDLVFDMGLSGGRTVDVVGSGSSKGVDLARFQGVDDARIEEIKRQIGFDPDLPAVCFVGRVSADKGLDDLIKASDIVLADGIDHQLVIAGGWEDQELADSLLAQSTAERPILMPGNVTDVPALMHAADIHCLPTKREGFPNVVLEASAAGIPTVTTNATGAIDSVVDGKTGLVAEVGDTKSLAHALSRLLADADLRAELGGQALQRAQNEFDQTHVIEGICDYIKAVSRD